MRKSFRLFMMLTGILCGTTIGKSVAQTTTTCNAPTAIQVTPSPAVCFGEGAITVNTVTVNGTAEAAPTDSSMRYQLVWDSAGKPSNGQIVKDWQASPTFSQVATGSYLVKVQAICSVDEGVVSAIYQSPTVAVGGTTVNIGIRSVTKLSDAICNNGALSVTATGGSGAYSYALMVSINATDAAANYVRPQQASDTFTGLPAGTYYVRVYDNNCSNQYATASLIINAVTDSATWPAEQSSVQAIYACDSISIAATMRNYSRFSSGTPDPAEKMWMQVGANGVADTLTGGTYSYISNNAYSSYKFGKTISFITYPDTIYMGYKSVCGKIFTDSIIVRQPKLMMYISPSGYVDCNNVIAIISFRDTANGSYQYYNLKLSLDSGRTWSAVNTKSVTFTDTLPVGQTYYIWATGSCGDTAKDEFQAPVPSITLTFREGNSYACPGNSGFNMQVNNYSGDAKKILFTVLQQPEGANLPTTFYDSVYNYGSSNVPYIYNNQYTYNLPLGKYVIQVTDACGNSATDSITLTKPMVQTFSIQPAPGCSLPANNGFTLTSNMPNLYDYGTIGIPVIYVIVTNTATGKTDSTFGDFQQSTSITLSVNGSTLRGKTNLTAGTYTIKAVNEPSSTIILPRNYYPTCSWDTTITLTTGGPLNVPAMLATSSCGNGTTSAIAMSVTGGSGQGSYTYQLQSTTDGATWTNVGDAQPTGIFTGVSDNTRYSVQVTDTCGNSTTFGVSFKDISFLLTDSNFVQPCTNDEFAMKMPLIDGAAYSWTANGEPIAGATSNTYTVTVPEDGNVVTYVGSINIGDCLIMSQPYTLDPGNCAKPFTTPITNLQLKAQVQANNSVSLNWTTTMEINCKNFTVQRSADGGKTWTNVGVVASKAINGNSSTPLSYTLTDANVQAGSYEYQIVETDVDGSTEKSNVVAVQVTGGSAKVYPIPASTYVRIILPAGANNVPYRMISTDGKVVLQGTMSNQGNFGQISVSGLASAVYFLQVTINNAVQTYKVQVQH